MTKHPRFRKFLKYFFITFAILVVVFLVWQLTKKVPTQGDWKPQVAKLASAEFEGEKVTVRNVRNFSYDGAEDKPIPAYYDETYDLSKISRAWFITEPFDPGSPLAHTLMSFEFTDGKFLAISIEGRLTNDQHYNLWQGTTRTYPLIYIPADERDVVFVRANIRKDDIFVYPVKAAPEEVRKLFVDMLQKMNDMKDHPTWYNSIFANCTSSIAGHVNKIWPGILSNLPWQVIITGHADELAIKKGLIDTDLSVTEARKRFEVGKHSQEIGRVDDYSKRIREFDIK